MKESIKQIYDVGIIDEWHGWECLFQEKSSPLGLRTIKPITTKEFEIIMDFISKLSKTNWEGDIRGCEEIYITTVNGYELVIGLKQDNNGTTYVGFTEEPGESLLNELCNEGCDFEITQVYPIN